MRTARKFSATDCFNPLPKRIRELREERKKTQGEIGAELNVSKSNIGSYESGSIVPPADKIVALAKVFKVSTDYLLGVSDAKTNNITEQSICDYLGLDIDTIRYLHKTKDDSDQHAVIDYFIQDEELLNAFEKHAWADATDIINSTRYRSLPFVDKMLFKKEEKKQLTFANLVHTVDLLPERFRKYTESNKSTVEKGIMKYCSKFVDVFSTIDMLSRTEPESEFIKTHFPSFDSKIRKAYPEDLNNCFKDPYYRAKTHILKALSSEDSHLLCSLKNRNSRDSLTKSLSQSPHFISPVEWEKSILTTEYKDLFNRAATDILQFLIERVKKADGNET